MPHADPEAARAYRREYGLRPEVVARRRAAYAERIARDPLGELTRERARKKKWAEDNPEKSRASERKHRARKRDMVLNKRREGCTDCGERDVRVIQLHAPEGHTVRRKCIGDGSRFGFSALERELAICVPLCANCHVRRHSV